MGAAHSLVGLAAQALKDEQVVDLIASDGPWVHEDGTWSDTSSTSSKTSSEDSNDESLAALQPAVPGAVSHQVILDDDSDAGQESEASQAAPLADQGGSGDHESADTRASKAAHRAEVAAVQAEGFLAQLQSELSRVQAAASTSESAATRSSLALADAKLAAYEAARSSQRATYATHACQGHAKRLREHASCSSDSLPSGGEGAADSLVVSVASRPSRNTRSCVDRG